MKTNLNLIFQGRISVVFLPSLFTWKIDPCAQWLHFSDSSRHQLSSNREDLHLESISFSHSHYHFLIHTAVISHVGYYNHFLLPRLLAHPSLNSSPLWTDGDFQHTNTLLPSVFICLSISCKALHDLTCFFFFPALSISLRHPQPSLLYSCAFHSSFLSFSIVLLSHSSGHCTSLMYIQLSVLN